MRRAIISDIHGNLVALEAALKDCAAAGVDEIVCLGDICGYGPDPVSCIDIVRSRSKWVLAGNHDAALFMHAPVGFNKFAADALLWQRGILIPHWYSFPGVRSRWKWLGDLPASREEGDVLYVHASPRDPLMEYVEEGDFVDMGFGPSAKALEMFEKIKRLSFCGHSHRPGVVTEEFHWFKPRDLADNHFKITPGKNLVNVGSIGQPRDNDPRGCYVIYDTTTDLITFRRVEYDIKAAQARFMRIPQIHEKLWKRLETGS